MNRPSYYDVCVVPIYRDGYGNHLLFPFHVKHWRAVPLSLCLYKNLYYFQLWMETITECLLPDEHAHTHIHTRLRTLKSNIQTHAESFTRDKRHPVGLRKRKRKREGREREGEERSSGGSLLLFHSLPLSLCTEETSPLSLHSPVSTVRLFTSLSCS